MNNHCNDVCETNYSEIPNLIKPIDEVTDDAGIDKCEWLRGETSKKLSNIILNNPQFTITDAVGEMDGTSGAETTVSSCISTQYQTDDDLNKFRKLNAYCTSK